VSLMLFYCREVGLEPTGDTYTVLMCDLAEKGDISGIEKVSCHVHIQIYATRWLVYKLSEMNVIYFASSMHV